MNYRELGKTGLRVSEIGMGCEGFGEDNCQNTRRFFDIAEECGINYFDLYTSNPEVRASVGGRCRAEGRSSSSSPTFVPSGKTGSISGQEIWRR